MEIKDIKDSAKYQISSEGFIINNKSGRVLKPSFHKRGYLMVKISEKCKTQWHYIHRLVATYFIPNPENKPQVNHKNGIVTDNNISNLEWVTAKENINHAYVTGLVATEIKVKQGAKLTSEQVIEIRNNYYKSKKSFKYFGEIYGVTGATIGNIIKRKTWYHL